MKHLLQPAEGEALTLGPPASGEVVVKIDPGRSDAPFAAGTETLLPGAEIPIHRHLHREAVLFVQKGQGRATLEGEARTVVPGTVVYAPRAAWHGLRNTGTGILQIAWVYAPSGVQEFFRELARSGAAASGAALQEIAKRHGIEFRPEGAPAAAPAPGPRRRHRRRRGGRGRQAPSPTSLVRGQAAAPQGQPPLPAAAVAPESLPSPPRAPAGPGRPPARAGGGRRRRRRRAAPPAAQPQPQATPPRRAEAQPAPSSAGRARREGPRRSRRRVKEVYMGGRWVRVTGEGPVISTESGSPEGGEAESEP